MKEANVNVWLVNTGWTGGPYGTGQRMKLKYTRAMINAALSGNLNKVSYETHEIFGIKMPTVCPNVPTEVLNPKSTWKDKEAYDVKAKELANTFRRNFSQFKDYASQEILEGGPLSLEYNAS